MKVFTLIIFIFVLSGCSTFKENSEENLSNDISTSSISSTSSSENILDKEEKEREKYSIILDKKTINIDKKNQLLNFKIKFKNNTLKPIPFISKFDEQQINYLINVTQENKNEIINLQDVSILKNKKLSNLYVEPNQTKEITFWYKLSDLVNPVLVTSDHLSEDIKINIK